MKQDFSLMLEDEKIRQLYEGSLCGVFSRRQGGSSCVRIDMYIHYIHRDLYALNRITRRLRKIDIKEIYNQAHFFIYLKILKLDQISSSNGNQSWWEPQKSYAYESKMMEIIYE